MIWTVCAYGFVLLVAAYLGRLLLKLRRRGMRNRPGELIWAASTASALIQLTIHLAAPDAPWWMQPLIAGTAASPALVYAMFMLRRLRHEERTDIP